MFGVRVAPGLLVSPIWSDSLPRLTRLMYIVASCATFHEPPCLAGDSHGRWCGGHCGLSCNRALWPPRERTCPRTAGRALRRRGACEASIRARCSGPCPQVVAIHTSRAMHASRVRGSCASGGPPSGTYLWQTSQLARTRSRPGGRATLLCHMPPPLPCTAHSPTSHGVHAGCDDAHLARTTTRPTDALGVLDITRIARAVQTAPCPRRHPTMARNGVLNGVLGWTGRPPSARVSRTLTAAAALASRTEHCSHGIHGG